MLIKETRGPKLLETPKVKKQTSQQLLKPPPGSEKSLSFLFHWPASHTVMVNFKEGKIIMIILCVPGGEGEWEYL